MEGLVGVVVIRNKNLDSACTRRKAPSAIALQSAPPSYKLCYHTTERGAQAARKTFQKEGHALL